MTADQTRLIIDGDVIEGRLMIYADSLAECLNDMADNMAAIGPDYLLMAGMTAERVARDLSDQLGAAARLYNSPPPDLSAHLEDQP